jgi:uncharacterized protein (AIM24 family)
MAGATKLMTAGGGGVNITPASSVSSDVTVQVPSVNATLLTSADTAGNFQFNSGYGSAATAYGCRAWVNFNGTGTVAIRASGNVSSITDNGTGDYTVNFSTSMPDANYSASISGSTQSNGATVSFPALSPYGSPAAPTTSAGRVGGIGSGGNGAQADIPYVFVSIFR